MIRFKNLRLSTKLFLLISVCLVGFAAFAIVTYRTMREVQVNGPDAVDAGNVPRMAFLAQNMPNPFGQTTSIRFGLPRTARGEIGVFDVQGRRVRSLVAGELEAGEHAVTWDGRAEGAETISLALTNPGGGSDLGANSAAVITAGSGCWAARSIRRMRGTGISP